MKTAVFYKKYLYLEYFNSRNTTVTKACQTLAQAKAIIYQSGVVQGLTIINK